MGVIQWKESMRGDVRLCKRVTQGMRRKRKSKTDCSERLITPNRPSCSTRGEARTRARTKHTPTNRSISSWTSMTTMTEPEPALQPGRVPEPRAGPQRPKRAPIRQSGQEEEELAQGQAQEGSGDCGSGCDTESTVRG